MKPVYLSFEEAASFATGALNILLEERISIASFMVALQGMEID